MSDNQLALDIVNVVLKHTEWVPQDMLDELFAMLPQPVIDELLAKEVPATDADEPHKKTTQKNRRNRTGAAKLKLRNKKRKQAALEG